MRLLPALTWGAKAAIKTQPPEATPAGEWKKIIGIEPFTLQTDTLLDELDEG